MRTRLGSSFVFFHFVPFFFATDDPRQSELSKNVFWLGINARAPPAVNNDRCISRGYTIEERKRQRVKRVGETKNRDN